MTIDIERLKVDREYWDSVSPEGAEYYAPECKEEVLRGGWYKLDADRTLFMRENPSDGVWLKTILSIPGDRRAIPRPEPKQQWDGEGIPPEGTDCEYRLGDSKNWFRCKVKAVCKEQGAIIECSAAFNGEQYVSLYDDHPVEFRPIRTKEQLLRDDLIALVGSCKVKTTAIADAILSHYNLEPKE